MNTQFSLKKLLNNTPSLQTLKTFIIPLNNGNAVVFQIQDVLEFIFYDKLTNEIEFLMYLSHTNSLTQEALECFFKHLMYNNNTARNFLHWQRAQLF